ncbi:MAG TPA: hypothetical protein VK420_00730 [Longimicrobium sp.]|nr:hypothetical protein [Longimicrobium sp.]
MGSSTEDQIQSAAERRDVAAEWKRAGGGFSVAAAANPVDLEALVGRTARQAPADHRLFFVAASWIGVHHTLVDMRRLGRILEKLDELGSAVAGAMLSVADEVAGSERVRAAQRHCRPLQEPRVLFERIADDAVLAGFAREQSLPLFSRWGLWHDEVSVKTAAVRPIRWILAHSPELRVRALIGASLEGEVVQALRERPRSIAELARVTGATYAATHEAVTRLYARGLAESVRSGAKHAVVLPRRIAAWLEAYPPAAAPASRIAEGA